MKTKSTLHAAFLLFALAAACSSDRDGTPAGLSVTSNTPIDNATGVPVNANVSATFNERMDGATLTTDTFRLTETSTGSPVAGTVIYAHPTAVFWPASRLNPNTSYTATITTEVRNFFGTHLRANRSWRFTTGDSVQPTLGVNLGTAGNFAILAKAAISTVPTSAVTGDLGISPSAASFITGFALSMDPTNQFSTSPQVIGRVYAADYSPPTPANLTTAVSDMEIAFTDAAARAPDFTELHAGNIGGQTLPPGVYKWGTGVLIPTDVTLSGSATGVWIFQIAQDLTVAATADVILTGGALPKNIFWQVTGSVTLGATSSLKGNILTATAITLGTGASIDGRLLAQTAVNLDGNTVVEPAK